MKKTFLHSLILLASVAFYSCSDKDSGVGTDQDREFMTMFRYDKNTGQGDTDPYNCRVIGLNTVKLAWYTVEGCAGYQIKWGIVTSSDGESAWEAVEAAGGLDGDTIITDPSVWELELKHLTYATTYSFAIRTLHSLDRNDPLNSKWYGYGDGRRSWDYLKLTTGQRYAVPPIIGVSYKDKEDLTYLSSFTVQLDRGIAQYTAAQLDTYTSNELDLDDGTKMKFFQIEDNDHFKIDYLEIKPNPINPDAYVPADYKHYDLRDANWVDNQLVINVEGLESNAIYDINVYDSDIPYKADACYNSQNKRVKGLPGKPIKIVHEAALTDTIADIVYDISEYDACKLNDIIRNYMTDISLAENQVFYLEGGKAYFISNTMELSKGLTFMTNPDDIKDGKGKAKLYVGGMTVKPSGTDVNTCQFAFARNAQSGDNTNVPLEIDSIRFMNLDISVPLNFNAGDKNQDPDKTTTGNYFFNDASSSAMGYVLNYFEVSGCTFQGFRRGFMRTKTDYKKIFEEMVIRDNEFYNMGFYETAGNGYGWFNFKGITSDSNPFKKFLFENNTIYDSPMFGLCTNDKESMATWDVGTEYNITIRNNTFVNFNTLSKRSGMLLFETAVPRGSEFTIENNLFMVARDDNDVLRNETNWSISVGARIKGVNGMGERNMTFNVRNNWSTNSFIDSKTGQIFNNYPFNTGSETLGSWIDNGSVCTYDKEELKVHIDNISNTELMKSPNPKHNKYTDILTVEHDAFQTDNLDGLYYNNTEKVLNSNIYKLGIGASKWREGIGK